MEKLYELLGIPFGWILYGFFSLGIHNYALLIVIITLLVRLLTVPSSISQQKGMAKTQRIQSKVRKIQEKYAGDQRKIQEETQLLYQREGFNPMGSGCGPTIIQFILLFGLIGVIYYPLTNFLHLDASTVTALKDAVQALGASAPGKNTRLFELLVIERIDEIKAIFDAGVPHLVGKVDVYDLIKDVPAETFAKIQSIDYNVFGISLGSTPGGSPFPSLIWLIPILSTVSTIGSSIYSTIKQKQSGSANAAAAKSMGCMTVGMAIFSLYFVINYPAGIGVYWITSGVIGLISSIVIGQIYNPRKQLARIMVEETIEHRSKENVLKIAAENKDKK